MPSFLIAANSDPRLAMGWVFLALGLGLFTWAGFDSAMGRTSVGHSRENDSRPVRREDDPIRFRRAIHGVLTAGAICVASSAYLFSRT